MITAHVYQWDAQRPMGIGEEVDTYMTNTVRGATDWLDKELTARFGPQWEWFGEDKLQAGLPMSFTITHGWAMLGWVEK